MMFEAHVTDEYRTRMSELLIVVAMLHYCAVSNLTDIIPCSDVGAYASFSSGNVPPVAFSDRNENSSFLISVLARNFSAILQTTTHVSMETSHDEDSLIC